MSYDAEKVLQKVIMTKSILLENTRQRSKFMQAEPKQCRRGSMAGRLCG